MTGEREPRYFLEFAEEIGQIVVDW